MQIRNIEQTRLAAITIQEIPALKFTRVFSYNIDIFFLLYNIFTNIAICRPVTILETRGLDPTHPEIEVAK